MYIPPHFSWENHAQIIEFIQMYSFGLLVSHEETCGLTATHLPFFIQKKEDTGFILQSHIAKANPQGELFADKDVLIIFQEPHAYISPSLYEKQLNVPTWNYLAVHIYGKVRLLTDRQAGFNLLENTMRQYEPAYLEQWGELPQAYKDALFEGIIPFEIEIMKIDAKAKLSQNKTEAEQKNIAEHLSKHTDTTLSSVGLWMKKQKLE